MSRENRDSQSGVMKARRGDGMTGSFIAKLIFGVFYNLVFFGGMLFLPAGTFDWPLAWAVLGLIFAGTIATIVLVFPIVRHPMYVGASLLMIGLPLWLESYAATALAIVPIAIIVMRILIEEGFLKRELKGYEDYTKRVRYRLIPFIW